MITRIYGRYTVQFEPLLTLATVTIQGLLLPEVVHEEDGPDALARCEAWVREQRESETK